MSTEIPHQGKVVVQFGSPWCGPCKQIRPLVEELAQGAEAEFVYVDVSATTGRLLAEQMGVQSVPTVLAIRDGQELGRSTAAAPNLLRTVISGSFERV